MSGRRALLSSATESCEKGNVGLVIAFFTIILYAFIGLAIICDEFFVPSLEAISEKLHLSEDVAGATFMAAGSSAPELFTSVADSFGSQNSIGIGTIVGSAMFNILVIVALAAAVTSGTLKVDWRPVARDVFFYSLSILLLFLVFGDGQADWFEGLIMVLAYGLYIVFMVFNQKIFARCAPSGKGSHYKVTPINANAKELAAINAVNNVIANKAAASSAAAASEGGAAATGEGLGQAKEEAEDTSEEEEGEESRFAVPDGVGDKLLFALSLPFLLLFTATVPDCAKERWRRWYLATFCMSILWIGGLCVVMVMLASLVGCMLRIDPPVMGIVVLAVGTSVPDALGSMIVAKQGEADMAIANAVGSNVFDILLGLGLPWMFSGLIKGAPQPVDRDGIEVGVAILFGTVLLFVGSIAANGFHMNNKLGLVFLALYVVYIAYTLLSESCVLPIKAKCFAATSSAINATSANATRT